MHQVLPWRGECNIWTILHWNYNGADDSDDDSDNSGQFKPFHIWFRITNTIQMFINGTHSRGNTL